MKEKRILTRSGYWITIQVISNEINHIIVRDSNLYPDSDSRSEENREWLVPINNIIELRKLSESIIELCKEANNMSDLIKENQPNIDYGFGRSNSYITPLMYNKLSEMCTEYNLECKGYLYMELCWIILNEIVSKNFNSPFDTIEQVKLFGIICFNNSSIYHPIDYLYDTFKEFKK